MTAGEVIRTVRREMGLTPAQLGALFGEGRWYISDIERGRRPFHEVRELAGAIDVRIVEDQMRAARRA